MCSQHYWQTFSRAGMPLNLRMLVLYEPPEHPVGLVLSNISDSHREFLSIMPNNPAIIPPFSLSLRRGKWLSISGIQSSTTSLLGLCQCWRWILLLVSGFQCWHLRAHSYWMSGGTCVKALCSLELAFGWWVNGVALVPTGTWGYQTVRFCKVLLKSPSNLNILWVCFVSFLPSLAVQFSLQKWSNSVP